MILFPPTKLISEGWVGSDAASARLSPAPVHVFSATKKCSQQCVPLGPPLFGPEHPNPQPSGLTSRPSAEEGGGPLQVISCLPPHQPAPVSQPLPFRGQVRKVPSAQTESKPLALMSNCWPVPAAAFLPDPISERPRRGAREEQSSG